MKKAHLISRIIEKLLLLPAVIWIYTPIIAGILITMTHYLPIGFASYWIFSFYGKYWLLTLFTVKDKIAPLFISIELILFILGLLLFLWGLLSLANVKIKKQDLATGGPYKFIRHPQHLGLILMTLATSLYLPWAVHPFIRTGSIISWSLFSLFLVVTSELEEKKLLKKYGSSYLEYRQRTGMFFPRKSVETQKKKELSEIKHWKRLIFIAVIYFCFVSLIRILCLPGLKLVGMWYDSLSKQYWYINLIALGLIVLHFLIKVIRRRFFSIEKLLLENKSEERIIEAKKSKDVQEDEID